MLTKNLTLLLATAIGSFQLSGGAAVVGCSSPTEDRAASISGSIIESIPFRLVRDLPIVALTVNAGGGDELFIVDSGFPKTIVDTEAAARSGATISPKPLGLMTGTGNSAGQVMYSASAVNIRFGRMLMLKGSVPATSLSNLSAHLGVRLSGILGYDFLSNRPTAIDYRSKRVTIYGHGFSFIAKDDTLTFDLGASTDLPLIEGGVMVGGRDCGIARILIDTGSERASMINQPFSKKHSLDELSGWAHEGGWGIGGETPVLYGLPGQVRMDNTDISIEDVAITLSSLGLVQSNTYDALLGGPIFVGHSLLIDAKDQKLYFIGGNFQQSHK